ncbi:MAG: hypothetical protein OJI67_23700 [Prosthecobacter sp.]|nr:hypothetical protein [Prosthecobacter sp.]
MTKLNPEKLLPKIEKAGIKASLKAGHVLSQEELLEVKVQLMPTIWRWMLGGCSAAAAYGSYLGFSDENSVEDYGLAVLAVLFFLFAVVGVRRTLGKLLDGLDVVDAGELLGLAIEGIGSVIGSIFD